MHVVVSQVSLGDKGNVKEVIDGNIATQSHKPEGKRKKKRMKSKRIKGNPHLTLVPQSFADGVLEYRAGPRIFETRSKKNKCGWSCNN